MKKGIYLIPHGGNFSNKEGKIIIGSSTHINKGIECLREYYDIHPYVINTVPETKGGEKGSKPILGKVKFGSLRDIKAFLSNSSVFFRVFNMLKKERPDFIYERSEYLSYSGVIAARLLKIPHFYEANWIHYLGIQQFYDSRLNFFSRKIEEWMYNHSNHVFFVGNQHKLLTLKNSNYSVIQNGVDVDIVSEYAQHENKVGDIVQVCVLASLMVHHRFDIFMESLKLINQKRKIKLHIIGVNFERQLETIPVEIDYTYHGPVAKKDLYHLLSTMNLAIISGGPFYSSFMKLYDYAAVKLGVICPALENIVDTFSEEEILYFDVDDAQSLAKRIDHVLNNPSLISQLGENLYQKVASQYTWQKIFERIHHQIEKEISS